MQAAAAFAAAVPAAKQSSAGRLSPQAAPQGVPVPPQAAQVVPGSALQIELAQTCPLVTTAMEIAGLDVAAAAAVAALLGGAQIQVASLKVAGASPAQPSVPLAQMQTVQTVLAGLAQMQPVTGLAPATLALH